MSRDCAYPDPICVYDGLIAAGEHDAWCEVWASDDVETCDCWETDGHRVRLTDSPTMPAAMRTAFACDDDSDEAAS